MMRIYKTEKSIVVEQGGICFLSPEQNWDQLINHDELYDWLGHLVSKLQPAGDLPWLEAQSIQAPIGSQELWAAGVTYLRSKTARMEESKESGGASFYDKVYEAERPELFFKASGANVRGPNARVRIRRDSNWNVPEPELTLVVTSSGKIVGYTIGNDMSSRSIEGENPLYLPQAKVYDGSAALGPCVWVTGKDIPSSTLIAMTIQREGINVFEGQVTIDQMKRGHGELVEFLYRENSFPNGSYLMTGTCIVPGNDFTLASGDIVRITIDGIGTLVNTVE
jgi:2-dehydro-3-deoxy-D-arabinonate dehydratase